MFKNIKNKYFICFNIRTVKEYNVLDHDIFAINLNNI